MNIYFSGSIGAGMERRYDYLQLIGALEAYGTVLTKQLWVSPWQQTAEAVFNQDMAWLSTSQLLVAEVSKRSLGIGFEIGYAWARDIPIILLYDVNSVEALSYMLLGNMSIKIIGYSRIQDGVAQLQEAVEALRK